MTRWPASWMFAALLVACSSSNSPVPPTGTTIGAGGGTVTSSDGQVSLVVPAGALQQDTTIDIRPANVPPESYLVPGTAYAFNPDGTEFAKPVTATFRYDPAKLPSGADEHGLQVTKLRSDGQRLAESSVVDTAAHTVAGQLTGFSTHAVMCCIPPRTPNNFAAAYQAQGGVIHLTWEWDLTGTGGHYPSSELRIERAEVILPLDSDFQPLVTLAEGSAGFDGSGYDDFGGGTFHPNLPVWYRIRGASSIYAAPPATVFVLIPPPSGTLSLTAAAQSPTSIALSWNNIANVDDYLLERSTGASGLAVVGTLANTLLAYTDTGLAPLTTYSYRLTANLAGGATAQATAVATTPSQATSSHLYVTDVNVAAGIKRVVRMDDLSGQNWMPLSGKSDGTDRFQSPWGIAVDAVGFLYVSDGTRIVKTDISGTTWTTLGGNAAGTDHFTGLEGIAVDGAGNIYVSDWGGSGQVARIVKTDITGSSWSTLGTTRGNGTKQFACPGMIALDSSNIYVADRCNGQIVRVADMAGTGWVTLTGKAGGSDNLNNPRGVALDASGVMYVADEGNGRVVATTMAGNPWTPIALPNNGSFPPAPSALAIDPAGPIDVGSYQGDYLVQLVGTSPTQFAHAPNGDTFTSVRGVAVGP